MKQLSLGIFFLSAACACHAQNKNLEGKYALKLYNTTSWQKEERFAVSGNTVNISRQKDFQLLHPTVALRLTGRSGNMQELELARMDLAAVSDVTSLVDPSGLTIPVSGGKTTTTNIALRYEYIFNFMKKKNSRWMPALGLALMPYFERSRFIPEAVANYPATTTRLGARGWVVPRISYAISSRFFVDLNIPFCITDLHMQWSNHRNPNLGLAEQRSETANFQGAPQLYNLRLGVGLKV